MAIRGVINVVYKAALGANIAFNTTQVDIAEARSALVTQLGHHHINLISYYDKRAAPSL